MSSHARAPGCPACGAPLMRPPSGWFVLCCASCGGVWADTAASRRIVTVVDRELVHLAKDAAEGADDDALVAAAASDGTRRCPVCAGALAHVRLARVTVDVCGEHGTWFDRDELGRLARNLEYERLSMPPSSRAPASTPHGDMLLALLGRDD